MPHESTLGIDVPLSAKKTEDPPWPNQGRAAVVISGAGARGAYEAGVMSVLLPSLFDDLRDVVLLGTSAGAVNAALWAQLAQPGRELRDVGEEVCAFWRELDVSRVYRSILIGAVRRILTFKWMVGRVSSLLDTEPLADHCADTFKPEQLARNIQARSVGGVGLVATTCPEDGTGGRSHVFLQAHRNIGVPEADQTSAIDYLPVVLRYQHILASAAIPIAFKPVEVPSEKGNRVDYYTDGGVRLNTPIAPALELDARRLVIVSSHATRYPNGATDRTSGKPDVVDVAAQSVHSILADGMIEDLRLLRKINSMVAQAKEAGATLYDETARPRRAFREVPVISVAPNPGELAEKARKLRLEWTARSVEYAFVRKLFAGFGRGVGNDELLSYLLFNRAFAEAQIDLGRRHAKEELKRQGLRVRV